MLTSINIYLCQGPSRFPILRLVVDVVDEGLSEIEDTVANFGRCTGLSVFRVKPSLITSLTVLEGKLSPL